MANTRTHTWIDSAALTRVLDRIAAEPTALQQTPMDAASVEPVPFVPKQYDHRPKWLDCKCGICGAEADMSDRHIPHGWKAVSSLIPGRTNVHLCCDECRAEWEALTA